MPVGRPFDGFVEYGKRVSPTCLVHLERNRYSVRPRSPIGHFRDAAAMRRRMRSAEAEHALLLVPVERKIGFKQPCAREAARDITGVDAFDDRRRQPREFDQPPELAPVHLPHAATAAATSQNSQEPASSYPMPCAKTSEVRGLSVRARRGCSPINITSVQNPSLGPERHSDLRNGIMAMLIGRYSLRMSAAATGAQAGCRPWCWWRSSLPIFRRVGALRSAAGTRLHPLRLR